MLSRLPREKYMQKRCSGAACHTQSKPNSGFSTRRSLNISSCNLRRKLLSARRRHPDIDWKASPVPGLCKRPSGTDSAAVLALRPVDMVEQLSHAQIRRLSHNLAAVPGSRSLKQRRKRNDWFPSAAACCAPETPQLLNTPENALPSAQSILSLPP